jgi:hypothetical protein
VIGAPVFVLMHDPPADYPRGQSNLTFVTDGIESAVRKARAVAGDKDIKLGGASPGKQALVAGLCDEILIHLAPYLLGGGVRLFDSLPDGIQLEKLSVSDGPFATHLRYRVIRGARSTFPKRLRLDQPMVERTVVSIALGAIEDRAARRGAGSGEPAARMPLSSAMPVCE